MGKAVDAALMGTNSSTPFAGVGGSMGDPASLIEACCNQGKVPDNEVRIKLADYYQAVTV